MQVSFVERSFKGEKWTHRKVFPYISNKQKKKKQNLKIEAIYMCVLERNCICLVREASELISVSHRQSHSGHNSANLNDTPVMTTSTQNISLHSLSLFIWHLLKAGDGEYLYGNVLTVLIINICFELYLELVMRLSDWELTHWKPVFVNIVG